MKGFIYLIEIAVAAILMTVALSAFFAIKLQQSWSRPDLLVAGNDILNSIKYDKNYPINVLNGNLSTLDMSKPVNIGYGLKIIGSPKSSINIGCYNSCDYLKSLLNPPSGQQFGSIFVNNRWINFTINYFDINSGIPPYDAIVLINYTNYSYDTIKNNITNYLNGGGAVIGINATLNNKDNGLNNTFNLSAVTASSQNINFAFYDPSIDEIEKYFLGIGMDAYGNWNIWRTTFSINYWGSNQINITNISNPSIKRTRLIEGSIFSLTGPDGKSYFFKVKKMWYPNRVDFQVLNTSFVFNDFSEDNVIGNNIVGSSNFAALTTNNSAVWMSNFPQGDEYRALLKAAILSRVDTWTAKGVYVNGETATLSSFSSLCCDMPETFELYLTVWYVI